MKQNKTLSRRLNILLSLVWMSIIILFQASFIKAQPNLNQRIPGQDGLIKEQTSTISSTKRYQFRVNVGGDRWIDPQGREWLADQRYKSASYGFLGFSDTYITNEPITGTDIPTIYQSERYKIFGYRVDVPNGHYKIIMHFAEIYHKRKGKRLIDIKIEGQPVYNKLDIFAEVGANAALMLTFDTKELDIPILDQRIDIEFIDKRDVVKLSAIEVIQSSEQSALLKIEPEKLDFGLGEKSLILTLKNMGDDPFEWSFKRKVFPHWLQVPLSTAEIIGPDKTIDIPIRINRSGIGSGIHRDSFTIIAPGFEQKIPLTMTVAGEAKLSLLTPILDFKNGLRNLTGIITNDGGSILKWSINTSQLPSWLKRIYPTSGTIEIGDSIFVNLTVSRKSLTTGAHTHLLLINSNDGSQNISLKISVPRQQTRHIYVKATARGVNDGSSWENAFTRLKDAIRIVEQLRPGEKIEIWVAEGFYYEHEILVPSGVHLYGGFQGNETNREERAKTWNHPTIIDGERKGRCFECEHRTVVDGFIIQNGRDWSTGEGKGAAILTYDADVQIRNNLIRDNVDSWAGALFVEGFETEKNVRGASPLIEHNVLINNFSNYCAAAIELRGSAATVRNNTIVSNKGFGLEIQDLLGPYKQIVYGDFYNNIITNNVRNREDDVWAEARKVTNYCYVGKRWSTAFGKFKPYNYGTGNIFSDITGINAGFIDEKNGDFRLKADSPCIDSGDPKSKIDPDGTRSDLGAFPFNHNQTELEISPIKLDIGSKSRKQNLIIKAYGGKPIQWRAAAYSSAGDIFSITPTSGILRNGGEARLNISVRRAGLSDGVYTGYIAVMTPEQSREIEISFTANTLKPELIIEPASVGMEAFLDGVNPEVKRIFIQNAGYGDLYWEALKDANSNWLRISPASGREGEALMLHFETSKLVFGNYHADIRIICSGSINRSVILPVTIKMQPGKFVYEIEAEKSPSLPNIGWKTMENDGATCIQATKGYWDAPNDSTRLDYEFNIPEGVEFVYVFAEVDVNRSKSNDSFWAMVNGFDPCPWDYIPSRYDGWIRSWVYHKKRDKQHMFVVNPGKNTFNICTRERGGFINWFVITNDPDMNIQTYKFGSHSHNRTN